MPDFPNFVPMEAKVLALLAEEGLDNKALAQRMFLSDKTIKTYITRLFLKLEVENRTQAAIWAWSSGWLTQWWGSDE